MFQKILQAAKVFCPAALILALGLSLTAGPARADWLQIGKDLLSTWSQGQSGELGLGEISEGLKEALKVGTARVVDQLGRPDGFNNDPAIHIPLPEKLQSVKAVLGRVGMASLLDDLELRINRAAETATPKAKEILWQAIAEMTLEDAKAIFNGPEDAATRYFESRMTGPLTESLRPLVEESLSQAGAVQAFDSVMGKYRALPFVRDVKTDLTGYVVKQGLAGIFHYLAQEEAAIRRDPAKRSTEILKRVFGGR